MGVFTRIDIYYIPNSKEISMTKIKLTEDQEAARQEIIKASRKRGTYLLLGYAGTGKTTLMDTLASDFLDMGKSVVVTATTHKAVAVLKSKITEYGVDCRTIHSLLSLRPYEDETGTQLKRSPGSPAVSVDVVIVDECSMVASDVFAWIERLLPKSFVLFVGDDAQLPPVNEDKSLTFNTARRITLSRIVRQAEGNPILQAATFIRESQGGNPDWAWMENKKNGKQGIFLVGDSDMWLRKAFTSDEFLCDKNSFRYLCWTNDRVASVNKKVQYWLYGDIKTPFAPGELVLSKRLYKSGSEELQNNEETIVDGIKEGVITAKWERYGGKDFTIPVWLVLTSKGITVPIVKYWSEYNVAYKWIRQNYTKIKPEEGEKPYYHITAFRDMFGVLQSNYAMTVHSSQGSTFKSVFVDTSDILKRQKTNLLECQQLFYVAITRASDMVFLVR